MSRGERFIQSLFPSGQHGESWGQHALVIDFVGGPYLFTGFDEAGAAAIREAYGDLCRPAGPGSAPWAVTETRLFRSRETEFFGTANTGGYYTLDLDFSPAVVRVAGPSFTARLDLAPSLSGALWRPETDTELAKLAFHNYFRVLVAHRLLALGGVLLHSAGVIHAGEAYLLLGPSGAGKSTFSRLSMSTGRQILSDDLNAVLIRNDIVVAEKLPFAGSLNRSQTDAMTYPLRFLGIVGQGTDNRVSARPLTPGQSVAALIAAAPFVNVNPYALDPLIQVAEALVGRHPIFPITFTLAGGFWDTVASTLAGSTGVPCYG